MRDDDDQEEFEDGAGEEWKTVEYRDLPYCTVTLVAAHLMLHLGARWEISKGHKFSVKAWIKALHDYNPKLEHRQMPTVTRKDLNPLYQKLLEIEPPVVEGIIGSTQPQLISYTAAQSTDFLRKEIKKLWPKTPIHVKKADFDSEVYYVAQEGAPSFPQLQKLAAKYMWSDDPDPILGLNYRASLEPPVPTSLTDTQEDKPTNNLDHLRPSNWTGISITSQKPTHRLQIGASGQTHLVQYGLRGLDVFELDANGQCLSVNGEPNTLYRIPQSVIKALFKTKK